MNQFIKFSVCYCLSILFVALALGDVWPVYYGFVMPYHGLFRLVGLYSMVYSLFEEYFKEPEKTDFEKFKDGDYLIYFRKAKQGFDNYAYEALVYAGLMVAAIIGFVIVYYVSKRIIRFIKNRIYKSMLSIRGVYIAEAGVAGSTFVKSDMPSSQVSFSLPGVLYDTHIGYGLRVKGCVITALHVLRPFVGKQVMISGSKGKALWTVSYKESECFADIVYAFVDANLLARIGVPEAAVMKAGLNQPMMAYAYGVTGRSSGIVRKNPSALGLLIYDGSTEQGMSGGAIWINESAISIHNGVLSGYNSSTYLPFIMKEVSSMFVNESSEGNIEQMLNVKSKKSIWDDLDFEFKELQRKKDEEHARRFQEKVKSGEVKLWSDEIEEESSVAKINGRLYKLMDESQSAFAEIEDGQVVKAFQCRICKKVFRTLDSLMQHKEAVHIKLESAIEYEDGDGATSSFLEVKKSPQKSLRRSNSTSRLKDEVRPSTSTHVTDSKSMTLVNSRKLSNPNPKTCSGQSLEKMRN